MRRLIESGEPALRLISELGDRAIKSGRGDLLINPASINWLPPVTDPRRFFALRLIIGLMARRVVQSPLRGLTSSLSSGMR